MLCRVIVVDKHHIESCASWIVVIFGSGNMFTTRSQYISESKVHLVNMGPIWVLSAPDGPLVDPMNLAIRDRKKTWCIIYNQITATIFNFNKSLTDLKLWLTKYTEFSVQIVNILFVGQWDKAICHSDCRVCWWRHSLLQCNCGYQITGPDTTWPRKNVRVKQRWHQGYSSSRCPGAM